MIMIWIPWIAASIAKSFSTPYWESAQHVVTTNRSFDVLLTKRTHFSVFNQPSLILVQPDTCFEPLLSQITWNRIMGILLASETKDSSTFTLYVLLERVQWLYDSIAIGSCTTSQAFAF